MEATDFERVAILGATGPTGRHLAARCRADGLRVRVVSRNLRHLEEVFPGDDIERVQADLLDQDATTRAVDGQDLLFDCVGLPPDLMAAHPKVARNISRAIQPQRIPCYQISSFWSYLPVTSLPLSESHPRSGGSDWIRYRRGAEDLLLAAGASILHLPDFYGPWVHTSVLQNALQEAFEGKVVNWMGPPDLPREHVHVEDAIDAALRLARAAPDPGRWIVPGSGPLSGNELTGILRRLLGEKVRIRTAGFWTLRMVSLFNRDLRGFMQMVPHYLKPISYDASKLEGSIGKITTKSYESGIAETLAWLKQEG